MKALRAFFWLLTFTIAVIALILSALNVNPATTLVNQENGFGAATGPDLTLSITPNGLLKGQGGAIVQAQAQDVTSQLITGYVENPGTIQDTDSILQAIEKLGGNQTTTTVLPTNGFGAATGPDLTLSTTVSGLLKGSSSALAAATAQDVTSQLLTGYVVSSGVVSSSDSILTALEKIDGNTTANTPSLGSVGGTSLVSDGTGPTLAIKGISVDSTLTLTPSGTALTLAVNAATIPTYTGYKQSTEVKVNNQATQSTLISNQSGASFLTFASGTLESPLALTARIAGLCSIIVATTGNILRFKLGSVTIATVTFPSSTVVTGSFPYTCVFSMWIDGVSVNVASGAYYASLSCHGTNATNVDVVNVNGTFTGLATNISNVFDITAEPSFVSPSQGLSAQIILVGRE